MGCGCIQRIGSNLQNNAYVLNVEYFYELIWGGTDHDVQQNRDGSFSQSAQRWYNR
jgi:hypothetical protein